MALNPSDHCSYLAGLAEVDRVHAGRFYDGTLWFRFEKGREQHLVEYGSAHEALYSRDELALMAAKSARAALNPSAVCELVPEILCPG